MNKLLKDIKRCFPVQLRSQRCLVLLPRRLADSEDQLYIFLFSWKTSFVPQITKTNKSNNDHRTTVENISFFWFQFKRCVFIILDVICTIRSNRSDHGAQAEKGGKKVDTNGDEQQLLSKDQKDNFLRIDWRSQTTTSSFATGEQGERGAPTSPDPAAISSWRLMASNEVANFDLSYSTFAFVVYTWLYRVEALEPITPLFTPRSINSLV